MRLEEMRDQQEKAAKELADKFSRYVNGWSGEIDDVVTILSSDHRTLQQSVTKFCIKWLEDCAKKDKSGYYDLRNEASVKLGKKFMEVTSDMDRAMPFI